jgi:hypothetical protein
MTSLAGMNTALLWLFGGITVAAIWVGVWWVLTVLGLAPRHPRQASASRARPIEGDDR